MGTIEEEKIMKENQKKAQQLNTENQKNVEIIFLGVLFPHGVIEWK